MDVFVQSDPLLLIKFRLNTEQFSEGQQPLAHAKVCRSELPGQSLSQVLVLNTLTAKPVMRPWILSKSETELCKKKY